MAGRKVVLSSSSKLARFVFGLVLIFGVLAVRIYALIVNTTKVQTKVYGYWYSKEDYLNAEIRFDTPKELLDNYAVIADGQLYNLPQEVSEKPSQGGFLNARSKHELFEDTMIIFSFSELVSDFWDAGAYFMSVLIVFGSCIVPITSCIFLSVYLFHQLYFVRNDIKTAYRRLWFQRLFTMLETVSCAALVDLIFQSYVQITLGNEVVLMKNVFLPGHPPFLAVSINANPLPGIATGVACTLVLMCCFPIVEFLTPPQKPKSSLDVDGVDSHLLEDEYLQEDDNFEVDEPVILLKEYASLWRRRLPIYLLFAAISIMCIVSTVMTWTSLLIQFELSGLTGLAVGKEQGQKDFKPIDVGEKLKNTTSGDSGIPNMLGTVYQVVVLLIPALVVLLTVAATIIPLRHSQRSSMLKLVKSLFTFSGFDILLLASIAAYLELPLVATWVFDNQFHRVCTFLDRRIHEDCILLEKSVGSGMTWLIVAVVLQAVLVIFAYYSNQRIKVYSR
mmetsp:Transcript_7406/g.9684  ORF Transcript_7406/g.9684 Transcript_7406/m.9684 type:complete len:504 (-) Transcript_7406:811-2322(-)